MVTITKHTAAMLLNLFEQILGDTPTQRIVDGNQEYAKAIIALEIAARKAAR